MQSALTLAKQGTEIVVGAGIGYALDNAIMANAVQYLAVSKVDAAAMLGATAVADAVMLTAIHSYFSADAAPIISALFLLPQVNLVQLVQFYLSMQTVPQGMSSQKYI